MTTEQRNTIKKDLDRAISHIARNNNVHNDEVESILIDEYIDEDDFIVISSPEVRELMTKEGFDLNASMAIDEWAIDKYGYNAFFVNKNWLKSL